MAGASISTARTRPSDALSGTGGTITLGSGTLTVRQSITTSFLGDISGSGGLTKGGARHADPRRHQRLYRHSPRSMTACWRSAMPITPMPASRARSRSARRASSRAMAPSAAMSPILAGGVVSPGGSIGTLTVGGNYTPRPDQPAADRGLADGGLAAQGPGQCQPRRQSAPGLRARRLQRCQLRHPECRQHHRHLRHRHRPGPGGLHPVGDLFARPT